MTSPRQQPEGRLMVNAAKHLALWLHRDQVDKQGEPYAGHLARVAGRVRGMGGTPEQVATAWLHDSIENGKVERQTLARIFGEDVAGLVADISRIKSGPFQQSYGYYIWRLANKADRRVLLVKLADLRDNMDRSRGPAPPGLMERYERALPEIMAALGEDAA